MSEVTLKRTPLFDFHRRQGARMVPFAGWEMPVQYTGILEEHRAVRTSAGLFDVSHMGLAGVDGYEAAAFLDRMLTNRVASVPVGKAVYGLFCREDGGVVDDLIVYRLLEDSFLMVLNASNTEKDTAWLLETVEDFDCVLTLPTPARSLLALQGPRAGEALDAVLGAGTQAGIRRFEVKTLAWNDAELWVARTGYTGEDGFELFVPETEAVALAEALCALEAVVPAGLGARDSLRLEAGFPLYGHEITEELGPLQAGLGFAVKLDKQPRFIGQGALAKQKAEGVDPRVRHFILPGKRIARAGDAVFTQSEGGEAVGDVLSGTQSPMLERPIGSVRLPASLADSKQALFVEIRGKRYPLKLARPPLHKVAFGD